MLGPLPVKSGMGVVIKLTQEVNDDCWEVEALFDLCFAPGREALSSYRLRDGVNPVAALCLVARDNDGILAGAIRYWPILVAGNKALLLGPVAVHPTHQGEGLGGYLIRESMTIATATGWTRVLLIGDQPYYGRFGFQCLKRVKMPPPTDPARILGHNLEDGAWDGVSGMVSKWGQGRL